MLENVDTTFGWRNVGVPGGEEQGGAEESGPWQGWSSEGSQLVWMGRQEGAGRADWGLWVCALAGPGKPFDDRESKMDCSGNCQI